MSDAPRKQGFLNIAKLTAIGLELAWLVVAGVLLGRFIDHRLKTAPWFMILGLLIGAFAGFYNIFKVAAEVEEQEKSKDGFEHH